MDIELNHVDFETTKKLNILESRLVNVNKRNKLLYTSKLYNKNGIDLYTNNHEKNEKLLKFLLSKKSSSFELFNTHDPDVSNDEKEQMIKKYISLVREFDKEERETGQSNAYIAYPYVIGKMQGDDFNIRAPLILVPVKFFLDGPNIYIRKDQEKDILWNSHLVLSHYKFMNKPYELQDNIYDFEEISFDTVIDLYKEFDINIIDKENTFTKFVDYNKGSFPKFQNGEFYLLRNCVLGNFSFYSSYLQKDYKVLQEKEEISKILSELLETFNIDNEGYDGIFGDREPSDKQYSRSIGKDKDIVYINDLNYSQEKVINAIKAHDRLVVQGPPGTGKSQTITSVIANFALDNKKILMVSQKKAALDVIYSRLGEIADKALILHDIKNKESFYSQLKSITTTDETIEDENKLKNLSQEIDNHIQKLFEIGQKLYYTNQFGAPISKIYRENFDNKLITDKTATEIFRNSITIDIDKQNYDELVSSYNLFKNKTLLSDCMEYINHSREYPWLNKVNPNLGFFEYEEFEFEIKAYQDLLDKKNSEGFIKSFKYRRLIKEMHLKIIQKYFSDSNLYGLNKVNIFSMRIEEVKFGLSVHERYLKNKFHYSTMGINDQKYFNYLYDLVYKHYLNLEDVNQRLYDYVIYRMISLFESRNKQVYEYLLQFKEIINTIEDKTKKKQEVTRRIVTQKLMEKSSESLQLSKRSKEFIRFMNKEKRKLSVSKFSSKYFHELFSSVQIWLLTPEVVSELLPMIDGMFDLVIFDEASQIYVERALPAISRGKKILITGDHMQLRPSSLGSGRTSVEVEDDDLYESAVLDEESLLDLARSKFNYEILNYHYRSKYEELIAFSNFAFYHGKLYVSPNPAISDAPPIKYIKVEDAIWDNRKNYREALEVVTIVKTLINDEDNQFSIGVISFNSAQRELILDLLDEESQRDPDFGTKLMLERDRKENNEDYGFFVKNIENVQGDERDIIIFSTAYAKNTAGRFVRNFGWLNQTGGENRLNVAISRAKHAVYLVTSITPDDFIVDDLKNKGPKIFKKYLEYAYAISNNDKLTAKSILHSLDDVTGQQHEKLITFDSIFEEEVYEKLTQKGYQVETQVGIGGYSIDLAIVDKKSHEYILGIECDGRTYHSSTIAKERDYYRQKYLESRGWKIHRIWSSDWWHNPEREIQKIAEIVTYYEKKMEQKNITQIKSIGYVHIINKLRRSNLEYKELKDSILFKLDQESIEVSTDGKMKSSYNDIRPLDIVLKEIDAIVKKKLIDKKKVIFKELINDSNKDNEVE
ncbi:MAG: AAA domain-containing protein [Bacilli bacterium]